MDDISEQRLSQVHPGLAQKTRVMDLHMRVLNGHALRVTQGFRTWAEQDGLWRIGRHADGTSTGRVVTNARGGWSMHNFGLAVDLCPSKTQVGPWTPDWEAESDHYKAMIRFGLEQGLVAGAKWKSIPDPPHFQLAGIPVTPSDLMRADFPHMTRESFYARVDAGVYAG